MPGTDEGHQSCGCPAQRWSSNIQVTKLYTVRGCLTSDQQTQAENNHWPQNPTVSKQTSL